MASIIATGVALGRGPSLLAESLDLTVAPGRTIGLVGPNGAGKTTLLRVLAGIDPPRAGSVRRAPRTATVGYLEQQLDLAERFETVQQWLSRRTGVTSAAAAMQAAAAGIASGDPRANARYSDSLEEWLALGGADIEDRMPAALHEVGLSVRLSDEVAGLSGGQQARLGLASLLLARHDIHLLDEPTNDLDLAGLAWLEQFLVDERTRGAGLVVVSHDRAFLEAITTDIVELDPVEGTATPFHGGFAAYMRERETARRRAQEAFEVFTARRDDLRARAQTTRQWADRGVRRTRSELERKGIDPDKIGRRARAESAERQAGKASRLDQAADRLDVVTRPRSAWELRYTIESAPRSGSVVASLRGATVERGSFRLGPVDLDLSYGDRVAIVGPNGAGKSTLLALLLGHLAPTGGSATLGSGVIIGEIDQSRAAFDGAQSLVACFQSWYPNVAVGEVRTLLAKFDLTDDDVLRPTAELSPGERTRATLARFQLDGVNLLVLDEPTNHLDLPAVEQLEAALDRYPATLLVVSHDRRLLQSIRVDRQWLVNEGQVTVR